MLALALLLAAPTAEEYLKKYDAIMGPKSFEAIMVMVAHREDDTVRTYQMKVLKLGDDKLRLWFSAPASAMGQEMLRQGENLWVYMPNIKRAIRLASRDSFQGGDFNNADILRANLSIDYTVKFKEGATPAPGHVILDCTSRSPDTSYDRIVLDVDDKSAIPTHGEYYASSGKLLRSADFKEVKDFHGIRRPSRIVMKNELAVKRFSELATVDFNTSVDAPSTKFVLDDLGR